MLRLVWDGLKLGAALFGVCVAALGGATLRMVGTYWGVGVLVVVAREAIRLRRARLAEYRLALEGGEE